MNPVTYVGVSSILQCR